MPNSLSELAIFIFVLIHIIIELYIHVIMASYIHQAPTPTSTSSSA